MRVYEAIVKGLEGIGVEAAFGGAGENAAGLMLALKHSDKITPVITKHEQAASFMACGYAMYTDKLGFCFATAGPGAFNLFSGLAVAMSDSYPVLAVSGYASLEWKGKGSLNETSGLNRTPDSQKMFEATTKKSFLLTDIADTCDVLEEAVNIAFEGRPGPVHIHIPENLTHKGVEVENYHDIRLDVAPVAARPGTRRGDRVSACGRDRQAEEDRGARRLRSDSKRCGGRGQAADRAVPDPAADDDGRQGNRVRGAPALGRDLLRRRSLQRLEGVSEGRHRAVHRQLAQPARHVQLPRGPVRGQEADPHQHLRGRDRQGVQGRLRDRLRCSPGGRSPRRRTRAEGRRGRGGRRRRQGLRGQAHRSPHGFDSPRRARADDRTDASAESDSARRRRRAPGVARVLRRAGGRSELPEGRLVRPDGRTRQRRHRPEDGASRPGTSSSAAGTGATCSPASS